MAEPVPLTVVSSEAEAEMIRGELAAAGIDSVHRPTNVGAGATGGFSPSGAREIFVRPEQLEDAQALLAGEDG